MATILGVGSLFFATLAPGAPCSTRALTASVNSPEPELVAEDPVETRDLLARVADVLHGAALGLSLPEIRARLAESTVRLQRAIAVGLRTRRLRRIGAHNGLRYVLNA
jgi:hypothetical protein